MNYTHLQQEFIARSVIGQNIFLTGKAGTGKSTVVRYVIERMQEAGKKVVAVAPTGIAANNIGGQTIHSLFGIRPFGILDFDACNYLGRAKKDVLRVADVIVIDEVSMLRPDILDAMHWTLRKNGLPGLDQKQVIFIGDLKQLPVVLKDNDRSVLLRTHNGDTFLHAKIMDKMASSTIDLDEVVRQNDPAFIDALNIVREGGKAEYFRQFVHTEPAGVVLAPHNATVAEYNHAGLAALHTEEFVFEAVVTGTAKPEDFSLDGTVRVKNGCKVMYCINSQDNPLRNGTLGRFVSHEGCHFIRVNETDFALTPVTVTKKEYVYNKFTDSLDLQELGSITQYPIRLAYALSIHKAQGMTFDEVTVDLRRPVFISGQLYTALSRVTTPAGLRIIVK